jgi:glycine hydroxymethyltransferase
VLRNARFLGDALAARGIGQLTGATDVPFVVAHLGPLGLQAAPLMRALDTLQFGCSAVPVPGDADFAQAHGLRLGVSALTTRGMREAECDAIAGIVADVAHAIAAGLPPPAGAAEAVRGLCRRFPLGSAGIDPSLSSTPTGNPP